MDIKIIPDERNSLYYPLNKDTVLIIKSQDGGFKSFGSVIPFSRVSYYLYHLKKDVKEEILPNFEKYMVANVFFGEKQLEEFFFFHIEYSTYPNATFFIFSYNIKQQICKEVYRFDDNLKYYERERSIDLFILNSNYFILQFKYYIGKTPQSGKQFMRFKSFLYDRNNKMRFEIFDDRIKKSGIFQLIPVSGNVCAIRLGYNLVEENRYEQMTKDNAVTETIGLVSISQLISDILLKLPTLSMEIIDEVFWDKTFTPIKVSGKYVIFSRVSMEDKSQEIFFYQFVTKETIMLLNKNPYDPEKLFPCVLHKTPYIVKERRKYIEFYNISKNAVEVKLPSGTKILGIQNDLLIISTRKRRFLRKDREELLEIYQFEGMKLLYREKLSEISVISTSVDNLYVFLQERIER